MVFWSAIVLALALSLDGLGVGFTYGLRKIKIPISSLMTIAVCSMLAMGISMFAGHGINSLVNGINTSGLGAIIIIGVGIWQIIQAFVRKPTVEEEEAVPVLSYNIGLVEEDLLFKIYLKPVGLVIQVLRTPAVADMDGSGTINFREALVLGFALAMDAFGAGFGAALAGFSVGVIPGVGISQILLVALGRSIGARAIPQNISKRLAFLPGLVLLTIGTFKLFR